MIGYFAIAGLLLASTVFALVTLLWQVGRMPSGGRLFVLVLPLALYAIMRLYSHLVMIPASIYLRTQANGGDEPIGMDREPDRDRVQQRLEAVDAVGGGTLAWIDDGVRDWLARPPGAERDRARNALLDRLYAYSASSTGDHVQRKAVNDLRLAINPWVKD